MSLNFDTNTNSSISFCEKETYDCIAGIKKT